MYVQYIVGVTMSAKLPPQKHNPETGIVIFPTGTGVSQLRQIDDYYEANFRDKFMWGFANFVYEKGYGACTPHGRRHPQGGTVPETWQECGRRLYGDRFKAVMARVIEERQAGRPAPTAPRKEPVILADPPPISLEEIPDPDF